MLVYKFGGASVKDSDGIRNLGSIVSDCAELLCVVVSAMGKTTNALEFVVDEVLDNRLTNALDKLEELVISCHRLAISELNLPAETLDSEFEALRPAMTGKTDIVVYETHLRDFTMSPVSGIENKGKFIALTESGTKTADGLASGIEHLKELGITHVQILPMFDYGSIDERTFVLLPMREILTHVCFFLQRS
jgi:aspartokinase